MAFGKYSLAITIFSLTSLLIIVGVSSVELSSDYCGIQFLYFQDNADTSPSGYNELVNYPSGNTEVDKNITIKESDGPTFIGEYIMPVGSMKNTIGLTKGLRQYTTFHYVSTEEGNTYVNFTAFRRYSNGTESNFYSVLTDDIDALVSTGYTTHYAQPISLEIEPTAQLGVRVYGQTDHPSPVTVHFVYQGSTNVSYFQTGYFVCTVQETAGVTPEDRASELGIVFGILGGLLGAVLLARRKKDQP
jgi:hypothetical protein